MGELIVTRARRVGERPGFVPVRGRFRQRHRVDPNTYHDPGGTTAQEQMELTSRQREILSTLIDGHRSTGSPVAAEDLAESLDRHRGTIYNHMQTLGTLGLVEGVTGPGGGYEPTDRAYEALGRDVDETGGTLTLAHGYSRIDVRVDGIYFMNVHHPDRCRARVTFRESVGRVGVGDPVVVGPTPGSRLVVAGEVEAVDDAENQVLMDVARAEAPLEAEVAGEAG